MGTTWRKEGMKANLSYGHAVVEPVHDFTPGEIHTFRRGNWLLSEMTGSVLHVAAAELVAGSNYLTSRINSPHFTRNRLIKNTSANRTAHPITCPKQGREED